MAEEKHCGTLFITVGPMFSGKTSWLNFELTTLADKGFTVLKINHSLDDRDDVPYRGNDGSSHNSGTKGVSKMVDYIKTDRLANVDIKKYNVIGVDEAQFFPDLYTYVEKWVENKGIHVRVSGLCGDAGKNKFGQVIDLIPICDKITKLNASCYICLNELKRSNFQGNLLAIEGPFTKRLGGVVQTIDIGGAEKYIPVCRYHHNLN